MDVDFSAAWLDLKRAVTGKPSHGARDLALLMTELEVKHAVPEDQRGYSDRPVPLRPKSGEANGVATHEPPRVAARDA